MNNDDEAMKTRKKGEDPSPPFFGYWPLAYDLD